MTRPWYRRFPDNFIGGTVGLTLEEKGAYSLVLDLMYVRGGPIPDEPRYIAGVCNCSVRKWVAIRARLIEAGKVIAEDGFLMNPRAQEEIAKADEQAEKLAENGSKGGNKSAEKRATFKKNNALAQAGLNHTTSRFNLKKGNASPVPTENVVRVSRLIEPEVFAACVEATQVLVPSFMDEKAFPVAVVADARKRLAH